MMVGNWSFFSRAPLTMASMMLGWSEPRFTKQCVTPASHRASKKAKDVVYISAVGSVVAAAVVERDLIWGNANDVEGWRKGVRELCVNWCRLSGGMLGLWW